MSDQGGVVPLYMQHAPQPSRCTAVLSRQIYVLRQKVLRFSQKHRVVVSWPLNGQFPGKLGHDHTVGGTLTQNKQQPSALVFAAYCFFFLKGGRCVESHRRAPPSTPQAHFWMA